MPDERSELIRFIQSNFDHFSSLPGSKHISSRSSALNLLELLIIFKPISVLDWGSGIGTLIPLYDFVNTSKIIAVEKNEWCRNQFATNTKVFKNLVLKDDLPCDLEFEFIVIDDEIDMRTIFSLISRVSFPKVIFIEGWRNRTIAKLSFALLLCGLSASFTRQKDRSREFSLSEREKSGAHFELFKHNRFNSLASWITRCSMTLEFREFKNFCMTKLGLFQLLQILGLGVKLRKMLKLKPKSRVKYWRREF